MEIIEGGPVPKWQQVADWLRGRIIDGEFGPDQRMPSETDVVGETGVARETARHAMRALREEGWIYTVHAMGSFVSRDRPQA